MKQEAGKNKKWLLPVIIGAVVLLIAVAVGLFFLLGNNEGGGKDKDPAATSLSSEVYWNVERQLYLDSATGLSIREPGEDGLFKIRFAVNGEQKEFLCADKKLVNRIDMLDYMGLQLDSDGNIVDVIGVADFAVLAADGFYVQKVEGDIITINSSAALNGLSVPLTVTDATGIYDVSTTDENCGKPTTPDIMDRVIVINDKDGNTTHIFINERPVDAEVYWRVDQYWGQVDTYNSTTKMTKRVPDENGVYTLLMACNGQQVEIKCKDLEIVNKIDSAAVNSQGIGLVMDEEGYAVQWVAPAKAVRGTEQANQWDITEVNGDLVSLERKLPGSNMGATDTFKLAPGCHVYDTTEVSGFVGIEIDASELRPGDRVYMLCNADREVVQIWLTNRMVDVPMYYLLNRSFDTTTNMTGLAPDENGWYNLLVSTGGKQQTVKTKDKVLASQICKPGFYGMGLKVENGIVKEYHHYTRVTGGWINGGGALMTSLAGPMLATEAANGTTYTMVVAADCKIYNCDTNTATVVGEKTTLKKFDKVYPIRDAGGEIVYIYITQRYMEGTVYYNPTRKYNSTLKETTRTPDAEGYYIFEGMTTGGKPGVTLKTKDKKIASIIDADTLNIVGLQVKGDIITAATTGAAVVKYGAGAANNCNVMYWETENESYYYEYLASGNGGTGKMNDETKIYNVSNTYSKHIGEPTTLKVGDKIRQINGQGGYAKYIYVVERETKGSLYFLLKRYDKDANGVWKYDYLKDGKVVTLQTSDPAINSQVGSYTVGCGIMLEGSNTIKRFLAAASLVDYGPMAGGNYDVVKISGSEITVKRNRPGDANDGKEIVLTKASGCKIYDVSSYGKTGKQTTLKVGDRVVCYEANDSKEIKVIFVTNPNTHEGGATTKCEHCGKNVFWIPYGPHSSMSGTGHYYLTSNFENTAILAMGANTRLGDDAYDIVLDLNGKTLTSTKTRAINVLFDMKLTIMDRSKAKTGTVQALGNSGGSGNVILVNYGGDCVIMGGTYKLADGAQIPDFTGAVIYVGNSEPSVPKKDANGNYIKDKDGNTETEKRKLTSASLTMTGGTVIGGNATYGGAIATGNDTTLNLSNVTIKAGKASGMGDSLHLASEGAVTIKDCTIEGDVNIASTQKGKVTISGKTQITKGVGGGLVISKGTLVDLTGLLSGSKLSVNATGVFTTDFKDATAAQKVAGYIVGDYEGQNPAVDGKALTMSAIQRCLFGHTEAKHAQLAAAGTPCAQPMIDWTPSAGIPKADGAYFLTGDVTTTNRTEIASGNIILDLNGYDITYNVPAARNSSTMCSAIHVSGTCNLTVIDNSTSDPAAQGAIKTIIPEFVPSADNEKNWDASTTTTADNAMKEDANLAPIVEAAKAAAALKGAEDSAEYKAEYDAKYAELFNAKHAELKKEAYDKTYASAKAGHDNGGYGMSVYVNTGASFTLMGGNLDASHLTTGWSGGAVYVNTNGTFNMVGGTVSGADLRVDAQHGGAICNYNGKVSITGGTVIGSTLANSANGGALYNNGANAVMEIGGNAVIKAGKAPNGDTMYVRFGKVIISGSPVINGGMQVSQAALEISGSPKIVKDENGSAYSLKIQTSTVTFKDLEDGAKIGITSLVSSMSTAGDNAQLQKWIDDGILYAEDGKALISMNGVLTAAEKLACVNGHTSHAGVDCDQPIVAWNGLTKSTKILPVTGGYYFLKEDLELTGQASTTATTGTLVIDLNGHNITQTGANVRVMLVNGGANVTIKDSVGGGKLSYAKETTTMGGGILYAHTGTLNLDNVIVDASNITSGGAGGALYILTNGIVNIKDCQIFGSKANVQGPAIWKENDAPAALTIEDSMVVGGVYNEATATRTFLKGKVQLVAGDGAYGLLGSAAAAQFDCTNLAADAKLVVGNCNYKFADAAAAQAAVDNGVIVAIEGKSITVNGNIVTVG